MFCALTNKGLSISFETGSPCRWNLFSPHPGFAHPTLSDCRQRSVPLVWHTTDFHAVILDVSNFVYYTKSAVRGQWGRAKNRREIGSLLPVSRKPLLRQRGELLHEGAGAGKRKNDGLVVVDVVKGENASFPVLEPFRH